jgi:hypothetical protein
VGREEGIDDGNLDGFEVGLDGYRVGRNEGDMEGDDDG